LAFALIRLLSDADTSDSGKAIALRLARDGYDLCINDVEANKQGIDDVVNQVKSAGVNAVGAVGDVSDLSQVESVIQKSVKELGPLNTM
jgi:NAD(P)-dependent dehydrogenase (short-subunit alcohol dehydrogenase family)